MHEAREIARSVVSQLRRLATAIELYEDPHAVRLVTRTWIEEVEASAAALRAAAEDFVQKVDTGRARSTDSYQKFSRALAGSAGRRVLERLRTKQAVVDAVRALLDHVTMAHMAETAPYWAAIERALVADRGFEDGNTG